MKQRNSTPMGRLAALGGGAVFIGLVAALLLVSLRAGDTGSTTKRKGRTMTSSASTTEFATFGGGCFWCIEAVFEQLKGVREAVSGYAGGHVENPSYRQVCTGDTGHAEVVRVEFDPDTITFEKLLDVFFKVHDPTSKDRQGADVGSQYRSVIFTHSDEQQQTARTKVSELENSGAFSRPIVTQIEPAGPFYPAEDYHQDYYKRNMRAPYCQAVIEPKLRKARSD